MDDKKRNADLNDSVLAPNLNSMKAMRALYRGQFGEPYIDESLWRRCSDYPEFEVTVGGLVRWYEPDRKHKQYIDTGVGEPSTRRIRVSIDGVRSRIPVKDLRNNAFRDVEPW